MLAITRSDRQAGGLSKNWLQMELSCERKTHLVAAAAVDVVAVVGDGGAAAVVAVDAGVVGV